MQIHNSILIALLAFSLAGCGEDDDSTDSTETTIETTTETTETTDTDAVTITVTEGTGEPASLTYFSSSQSYLAIEGTGDGDRSESSLIIFQLVDDTGTAITDGYDVTFSLSGASGASLSSTEDTSSSTGYVSTTVNSGKVSGTVTVSVVLDSDSSIYATSSSLAITTGLPDQDSFSISTTESSPAAWTTNGVTLEVTIQMGDHNNNTVPDGTKVFFNTEGGMIQNPTSATGSCETLQGTCSMNWISSDPRPDDGRVTITAYAVGEESFTDRDGDGWFTTGDSLVDADVGDVFYDHDENGYFTESSTEEFVDMQVEGEEGYQEYTAADGVFTGVVCSEESELAGDCINSLVHVWGSAVIVMASNTLACYFETTITTTDIDGNDIVTSLGVTAVTLGAYEDLILVIEDENGNTPPSGTTVSVTTGNGTLSSESSWEIAISPSNVFTGYTETVTIDSESVANGVTTGDLDVTLTAPDGTNSSCSLTVNDAG